MRWVFLVCRAVPEINPLLGQIAKVGVGFGLATTGSPSAPCPGNRRPSTRDAYATTTTFILFSHHHIFRRYIISADGKTKLLLSKPTATLHGDSTGAPHSRCSPGSCVYRRNLTIAVSEDGGNSWAVQPWGLVYTDRVAYSDMAELPSGKVAVVFERGTPAGEYRFLSVAIVRPPWAAGRG